MDVPSDIEDSSDFNSVQLSNKILENSNSKNSDALEFLNDLEETENLPSDDKFSNDEQMLEDFLQSDEDDDENLEDKVCFCRFC